MDPIDPHLRGAQNGFRKGRSTVAQILALRRLIEEVKRNNLTAVLCFVDFHKPFDSQEFQETPGPVVVLTDLDNADDICLGSKEVEWAEWF